MITNNKDEASKLREEGGGEAGGLALLTEQEGPFLRVGEEPCVITLTWPPFQKQGLGWVSYATFFACLCPPGDSLAVLTGTFVCEVVFVGTWLHTTVCYRG